MRFLSGCFILLFSCALPAQDFPNRPLRLVGGKISESLGQPVVVENRMRSVLTTL